jgi:hypothetical protein
LKKLIIFSILLAAIVLSAVNPWPAQLKVWNWTGDNIYFRLSYRGEQKYFLTATPQGNTDTYRFSLFEVARKKYSSEVTACGVTTTGGSINLNNNLKLTFTDCAMMRQWWRPLYWGEPGMEKPNFYQDANVYQWNVECEWVFPPAPLNPVYLCFPLPDVQWTKSGYALYRQLEFGNWRFQYDLPADYEKDVDLVFLKDECLGGDWFCGWPF